MESLNYSTGNMTRQIKLSQNENAYGASPLALKAIEENYTDVFRYPDVLNEELKQKIASKFDLTPEHVVITAGSIALMDMSIKTFSEVGENIVTAEITFEGYRWMARINRRECRLSQLVDNTINLDNMLALCDDKTRVVFIANLNNPTGTIVTHTELENFLEAVSSDTYVVSDEAYAEYITDPEYPDTLELMKKYPNLIIFHTFSKIYGLAGLRIAYGLAAPEVIQSLADHKTPFSINSLSALAASAALDDTVYIEKSVAVNATESISLYSSLIEMGFNATEPKGNFILVEFDTADEKDRFYQKLLNDDIIVRPLERFGMDLALRITVGRPEENDRLVQSIRQLED